MPGGRSEDIVLKGRPEQLRELISKVESRKLTDVLEKQVFELSLIHI